jgi:hypothetical protein
MRYLPILLLAGCVSGVEPYGPDTYIVSVTDHSGGSTPGDLRAMAAEKAEAYCADRGKKMQAESVAPAADISAGSRTTLIFTCR